MRRFLVFSGEVMHDAGAFGTYRGDFDDFLLACAMGIDDGWIDVLDTHTGLWCSADAGPPHKWTEWRSVETDWDSDFVRDSPPPSP